MLVTVVSSNCWRSRLMRMFCLQSQSYAHLNCRYEEENYMKKNSSTLSNKDETTLRLIEHTWEERVWPVAGGTLQSTTSLTRYPGEGDFLDVELDGDDEAEVARKQVVVWMLWDGCDVAEPSRDVWGDSPSDELSRETVLLGTLGGGADIFLWLRLPLPPPSPLPAPLPLLDVEDWEVWEGRRESWADPPAGVAVTNHCQGQDNGTSFWSLIFLSYKLLLDRRR